MLTNAPRSDEDAGSAPKDKFADDWDAPNIELPPVQPVVVGSGEYDDGDAPTAEDLEAAHVSRQILPSPDAGTDAATTPKFDFDKFTTRCLDAGAELAVIGVVTKYLRDGGKENTAEIIVKGSIEKGYDQEFAKRLCAYAKAGKNNDEIIDLISAFKKDTSLDMGRDKNNGGGNSQLNQRQNSPVSIGFSRLFKAVQSVFSRNDVVSVDGISSAKRNLDDSVNALLNSNYSKSVNAIKDNVTDPDQRNKALAGIHPDKESTALMNRFNEAASNYEKAAMKTIGKCKDPEEIEMVKATIQEDITKLKSQYSDKLEGMEDSSKNALKDMFDKLGKKIDSMIEILLTRLTQRQSKTSSLTPN